MNLIVGLGNPGTQYINTRHNVGFMYIDNYLGNVHFEMKFNGLYYSTQINGKKTIFLKPQSYMNLSGTVVKKFVDYYKIDVKDILVIRDDLDMELGQIRIKENSASGGDNGVKNIIDELQSQEFTQLKIGIAINKSCDKKTYVLEKFSQAELKTISDAINRSLHAVDDFRVLSIEELKSKYNGKYDEMAR